MPSCYVFITILSTDDIGIIQYLCLSTLYIDSKLSLQMADRHPFRANWHDYDRGIYFVTICTCQKAHLFGKIRDNEMHLSEVGKIVKSCIDSILQHHDCEVWNQVIMPNHIHMVLAVGAQTSMKIWQRNYHEHIIRDQWAFDNIMGYIDTNVENWYRDCFNTTA